MRTGVLALAFIGAVGLFAGWLAVMLRHERAYRVALIEQSRARSREHRRAALAAQRAPEVVVATPAPVVRPGSFCRVPGSVGRSKRGVALVCERSAHGRPRWRQAQRVRAA
jgi:hypothetical protein